MPPLNPSGDLAYLAEPDVRRSAEPSTEDDARFADEPDDDDTVEFIVDPQLANWCIHCTRTLIDNEVLVYQTNKHGSAQ